MTTPGSSSALRRSLSEERSDETKGAALAQQPHGTADPTPGPLSALRRFLSEERSDETKGAALAQEPDAAHDPTPGSSSALPRSLSEERSDETKGAALAQEPDAAADPTPGSLSEDAEGDRDETPQAREIASFRLVPRSARDSLNGPRGRIRLIATDLDGTLLDPSGHVTARTRAALDAARAAGIIVVPVTARQPIGLRAIGEEAGFDGWALCGNGAYGIHLRTREQLFASEISASVQQRIARELGALITELRFASVREAGEVFVAQEGYSALASHSDHKRDPATMGGVPLAAVLAAPSLKLVARHATTAPAEIFAVLRTLDQSGFEATLSGAPFVEIMAEGVTKATGLAQLCAALGIDRTEVLAFGDALNDVEMLRWAGRGVAMANAEPEALAAAEEVTASNAGDGVAVVVERVLAG